MHHSDLAKIDCDDARRRINALHNLFILDTPPEAEFDDVVMLAAQICQTPVALVSFVTDDRQWFKARVGFSGCETPLSQSVCACALRQDETFIIPDLSLDERTKNNTLVTEAPSIRFYAGALLRSPDGTAIGTLCVIDTIPRPDGLSEAQRLGLEALARQVNKSLQMRHLLTNQQKSALHHLNESENELRNERSNAELREQFVGILGHDLRNPLGSIHSGLLLLDHTPLNDRAREVTALMHQSVARMTDLVSNMLDFTRTRLGSGIALQRTDDSSLQSTLEHVVDELRLIWPRRQINAELNLPFPVNCDSQRIAQLFSNLLSNALTHGAADKPIEVFASSTAREFTLSVANEGKPIPCDKIDSLFKPFSRGSTPDQQGLGLGLHIASEIARAHDGKISAASTVLETRFTFRMPAQAKDAGTLSEAAA